MQMNLCKYSVSVKPCGDSVRRQLFIWCQIKLQHKQEPNALTLFSSSTTTRCLSPRALKSLNTRGSDVSCKKKKKKNNKINISVKVMNTGHTSASRILFTVIHFVCVCVTCGTVYGVGFMNSVRSIIHSRSSWETWMLWMGGKRG